LSFLTAEQVAALADAITPRYRLAVTFAAYEGLRAGELWALKARRVNELTRAVDVVEAVAELSNGELIEGPTKTGKVRTIGLPTFLLDDFKTHLSTFGTTDEGHVFSSTEGAQVRHGNFRRRHFEPAVRAAGLPERLRWHDLRHTCAALLIDAGRHLEEIKDHLGHSSIRVTSDRHGHLFPKARVAVADALDVTYRRALDERFASSPRPEADLHVLGNATEAA
jgi:integrase